MVTNNSSNYSPTQYNTQVGGASGTLANVSPGTSGQILTSNGAGSAPTFTASTAVITLSGDVGSATGTTINITGGTSGAVFTGAASTLTESFNFLSLPSTDNSGNGQVRINSVKMLQNWGGNLYVGNTGNTTGAGANNVSCGINCNLSISSGTQNAAFGVAALANLNTGSYNCAYGTNTLVSTTGGSYNIAIGNNTLTGTNVGSYNIVLGPNMGQAYLSSESSNIVIGNNGVVGESNKIRIGTSGSGIAQQNACYIAGITGVTPVSANTPQVVLCDNAGNLAPISSSTSGFILTSNGSATPSFRAAVASAITGDSGGALSPTAGNWNILGGPGVTTTGTGSTLTINSVVFTDTAAATLAVDNGYFATGAGNYPLPATAVQGEILIVVCDTAGAVVLDAPAANFIRVGSSITSSGGTATSNAIGDSLTLRYRLSSLTWEATSVVGTWTIA